MTDFTPTIEDYEAFIQETEAQIEKNERRGVYDDGLEEDLEEAYRELERLRDEADRAKPAQVVEGRRGQLEWAYSTGWRW